MISTLSPKNNMLALLAILLASTMTSVDAQDVVMSFFQQDSSVIAQWTGSLGGLSVLGPKFEISRPGDASTAFIYADNVALLDVELIGTGTDFDVYIPDPDTFTFATNGVTLATETELGLFLDADTSTGNGESVGFTHTMFGDIEDLVVYVPGGYVDGQPISGSMEFENTDLAALGIQEGFSATVSWEGGSITFQTSAPLLGDSGFTSCPATDTCAVSRIGRSITGYSMKSGGIRCEEMCVVPSLVAARKLTGWECGYC